MNKQPGSSDLINVNIEKRSIPFLKDCEVNFDNDTFGGQLTIKAPNAKMPNIGENSTIEDKINFILYNEINPMLASHGGEVSLIEFTEDSDVILQFGGGCQGCGMIDITLHFFDAPSSILLKYLLAIFSVILVGAINVSSIETQWKGEVSPPMPKKVITTKYGNKNISFDKGNEIGMFKSGSTVILLFTNKVNLSEDLKINQAIRVGEKIGIKI